MLSQLQLASVSSYSVDTLPPICFQEQFSSWTFVAYCTFTSHLRISIWYAWKFNCKVHVMCDQLYHRYEWTAPGDICHSNWEKVLPAINIRLLPTLTFCHSLLIVQVICWKNAHFIILEQLGAPDIFRNGAVAKHNIAAMVAILLSAITKLSTLYIYLSLESKMVVVGLDLTIKTLTQCLRWWMQLRGVLSQKKFDFPEIPVLWAHEACTLQCLYDLNRDKMI